MNFLGTVQLASTTIALKVGGAAYITAQFLLPWQRVLPLPHSAPRRLKVLLTLNKTIKLQPYMVGRMKISGLRNYCQRLLLRVLGVFIFLILMSSQLEIYRFGLTKTFGEIPSRLFHWSS